ncbi:MAG: SGNH/GDSL hydrolase family protein [Clostridia bacterium]|nr:SGNH/GDSL hydrolase family protein [Clostridia bacterium]
MYLDFESIRQITVGSVRTWQAEDGVHFSKYTEEGIKVWESEKFAHLAVNAKALTGVRFDFETDSSRFSFSMSAPGHLDIYVDDLLYEHISNAEGLDLPLDGSLHHITVYLPAHNSSPAISHVWVEDGAKVIPHKFDTKILFIGDSITQGWDSVHGKISYDSLYYANIVSRHLNAESVIQGVGGTIFAPETVDTPAFDPDMVFVALGTNDFSAFNSNLDRVYAAADEFLKKVGTIYAGKKLYCISPIWSDRKDKQEAFDSFCTKLQNVIRSCGFTLIDGYALVPHQSDFYSDEWLHPNALGFTIFAERLLAAIGQ